jgi:hypothetical protein
LSSIPTKPTVAAVERPLDFAVIGASKCGTTSLFYYLREHPAIYLPAGKGLPFFTSDEAFGRGWRAVLDEYYVDAPPGALRGTVTPKYMEDPRVPGRIHDLMPAIRLVAILRNPIDRAFSQYRQQVRRGKESRPFADAIREERDPARLSVARSSPHTVRAEERYLATGEYGRILTPFYERFGAASMKVVYTERLETAAEATLQDVLGFLGRPGEFRPAALSKRYHEGGSRERFPGLLSWVRRLQPLRALWHVLPSRRRREARAWFFTQLNVVAERPERLPDDLRRDLTSFFAPDVEQLQRWTGEAMPWPDFATPGR